MSPPRRIDPARVRTLPPHLLLCEALRKARVAWVDHRLRGRLKELSLEEIVLLFFLHLSADRHGLSFRADSTIAKTLGLKEGDVTRARYGLVARGLIAYRYPLFQILPLEDPR